MPDYNRLMRIIGAIDSTADNIIQPTIQNES